jgi:hypothetical protein
MAMCLFMSLFARLVDGNWDVAEDGYDASFHTKAWMEARFAASQEPKETFEEYRVRKAKEDAEEQAKERELEDAEGVETPAAACTAIPAPCQCNQVCERGMTVYTLLHLLNCHFF